jgi:hypothetical protein
MTRFFEQVFRPGHLLGRNAHLAVRHDVVVAVAPVELRLENLHLLPRDLRAAQAPNQLLALAAEHAAGDDFDPAAPRMPHDFHGIPRKGPH